MKRTAVILFALSGAGLSAAETRLAPVAQIALATPTPAPVVAVPAAYTLTLKAQAVSAGDEVLLSEVAELAKSEKNPPAWMQTPVSRAAAPGQMRSVYAQEITAALRRGGLTETVEIIGANESHVTALAQTIAPQEVDAAIRDAVAKAFSNDADLEAAAEIISQQPLGSVRPGPFDLSVDIPETGLRPTTQSLRLRVSQNGRRATDAAISVRIRVTGTVSVAVDRIAAGAVLSDNDIKSVRRELSIADLALRGDSSDIIGMRVKQGISASQIVHHKLLAAPLVVKRGDSVSVTVRRGELELHVNGEARTDAAMNEMVRVFIPDSNAEIIGRASGPRDVVLDEPRMRAGR